MHIRELILQTNAIHRTKLFYNKTLELEILDETEQRISFKAGKTTLTFEVARTGKPFYHIAFNITNNKFSDSFEWLSSKLDILPVSGDMLIARYDSWNAQSFYFYDNNGSIVEFIVRFDLPYNSVESFSSKMVEEVSEIGIVTEDVEALAERLHNRHGIPYFSAGPRLPDFVVMGDDYGLLLVCQQKRGWEPTHKAAKHFRVRLMNEHGEWLDFGQVG